MENWKLPPSGGNFPLTWFQSSEYAETRYAGTFWVAYQPPNEKLEITPQWGVASP